MIEEFGLDRKGSSTKMHIRISWTGVNGFATWPPPRQIKVIPGYQSKTPVAQMHFGSTSCPRETGASMANR